MLHWPGGAQFGAVTTVHFDAETLWISKDPANRQRPGVLSQGAFAARVGLRLLLDVFERHDLRTTVFVPAAVAEHYPEAVSQAVARGHHVGHHGYEHERLDPSDPEGEEAILVRGVDILTSVTGERPRGYCAPSWDPTPNTLSLLARHGFSYSTNFMDDIRPYFHQVGGRRVAELPVHWLLDDAPFRLRGPGVPNTLLPMRDVLQIWEEELEGLRSVGGLFNLTLHPQASGRPSAVAAVDRILRLLRAADGVWLGTCEDLADHCLRQGQPGATSPASQ